MSSLMFLFLLGLRLVLTECNFKNSAITMFFGFLLLVIYIIMKDFKYIRINTSEKTMKWFSPLKPFGKTTRFSNYVGVIQSTEYGSGGDYKTAHLVDQSMYTRVKINGLFYTNFDEMFEALELKEIKRYEFGFWKYIKLLFTGKIKIITTSKN